MRLKHANYWNLWCKYCAKEFKATSIIGVLKNYLSRNSNNILLCVLVLEDLQICKNAILSLTTQKELGKIKLQMLIERSTIDLTQPILLFWEC